MKTIKTLKVQKSTAILFGLFLSFCLSSNNFYGQEITVKGIVKGQSFETVEILNGANIFLKDTKTGTSTNKKGEFTFPKKLNIGDVLEISYLGYVKKRVTIKPNSSFLNITLQEDDNQMLGALNSNKRYKSKRQKD
ncbi:carboxypeptidase-like regulatory domain-containing protein [Polaribacter sp. R77954]|uniref:carboxypeptidase-like regulatory domain-containing protein n=1 Tax=Polaribacter sp. R77954 TaxID=3093870 RepID=UPI0037C6AA43